jgi:catechol 2,3-dioxygenase-like lactoylglutathione lyase family enzyme
MRVMAGAILTISLFGQPPVVRPKILGLAHAAYYVSDLNKACAFYEDFFGFAEMPLTLRKPDGSDRVAFIKINDTQYLELFAETPKDDGMLNHIAISTSDADRMRDYLASKGVKVPDHVGKGQTGNKNFTITDPDGHSLEIVEYLKDSRTSQESGKYMPDTRISAHLMHTGILIGSLSRAVAFYHGVLGFEETWRGGGNPNELSWVNLRVPDGEDYVEFMLYRTLPDASQRGGRNHISLTVPNMASALATLEARPARQAYHREFDAKTGVNGKRQANFYDPDGTRTELMEPVTVSGKPTPPSTAPPPIP